MSGHPRLVKIEHERCREWDGNEYVLAPESWDDERIRTEIRAAQNELIADAKQLRDPPCANPGYHPDYKASPDLTVAEVQRLHGEQVAAYKAWREENKHLSRSLEERLRERGFIALWDEEETGVAHVYLSWGHNHGLTLNYKHAELPA